ncbi:MAG: hypothetical protein MZV63_18155 [Marinilabiliales bacterium]|nr:hypothetical protein [Marinilabiliales bacterium]
MRGKGRSPSGRCKLRIGVAIAVQPGGGLDSDHGQPRSGRLRPAAERRHVRGRRPQVRAAAGERRVRGKLNAAGTEIAGTWTQGSALPLVLKRVEKLARPARPQEPKPPFPYRVGARRHRQCAGPGRPGRHTDGAGGQGPVPGSCPDHGQRRPEPR